MNDIHAEVMSDLFLWETTINRDLLDDNEVGYLKSLPSKLPSVNWVWQEMDRVWEQYGLNNRLPLGNQQISDFYSHPVWLMNGIFTQLDPVSSSHRSAIAKYFQELGATSIADYGGGFGELALAITRSNPDAQVSIIEPYPSLVSVGRIADEPHIRFTSDFEQTHYDVAIAQDVLEHVENPVELAWRIASAVPDGGHVVFANCFYPVIQCHLPSTFHLRHTFPLVMKAMGLRYAGVIEGAAHAQIFERIGLLNFNKACLVERFSRLAGPAINAIYGSLSHIKQRMLGR